MLQRPAAALALTLLLHFSAAAQSPDLNSPQVAKALATVDAVRIQSTMRFLADDLLEGREAGTRGYDIAARYVAAEFEAIGLEPAGTGGSWYQQIPFRAARAIPSRSSAALTNGGSVRPLEYGVDYVLSPNYAAAEASAETGLVFVGFGVTAPEMSYDDYAGVDVRGKMVVVLKGAPARFPHNQRAYYSSTLTKHELAQSRGAVGMLQIRTPDEWQKVPWSRVIEGDDEWGMRWVGPEGKVSGIAPQLKFLATMSAAGTEKLFQNARRPLQSVFDGAALGRPQSFALPGTIRTSVHTEQKSVESANVIGVLRGSDPSLRDEYVIYTAHLDHEGMRKEVNGDAVFNGAYDNASGIATMLEVARAFKATAPPRRSILFAAVTAEEKGLQGADYFANFPTVPANRIVANVNLDMFLALFPVRDLVAFGAEHSSLGPVVERAATQVGFKVSPDFAPEEVIFIRSDQYPFVKQGVPAVFIVSGVESGDPAVRGMDEVVRWTRNVYHTRKDDLSQNFHFPSLVKFAQANFLVGHIVASETTPPSWNRGDFFGEKFRRRDR
jgi:hypothetical protein